MWILSENLLFYKMEILNIKKLKVPVKLKELNKENLSEPEEEFITKLATNSISVHLYA